MNKGYIELDIKKILRVLIRHWFIVVACAIIFGAVFTTYSSVVQKPIYKVSVTIFVGKDSEYIKSEELSGNSSNNSIQLNDLKVDSQIVFDMADLLKTNYIIDKVIKETEVNLSVNQIKGNLEVGSGEGSRFMTFSLKGEDSWVITQVINTLADVLVVEAQDIMALEKARVIDYGSIPQYPVSPNVKKNGMLGVIFGILVGSALPIAYELIFHTYREIQEVKKLDVVNLGVVPMRKKVSAFEK